MPNLGPGVPNNVSVTPVPLLVFTPTPNVTATARFFNPGSSTVYIGGANVSPLSGIPVRPGNRPVELANVNVSLYACSGYSTITLSGTTSTTALTNGGTAFTMTSGASLATSAYFALGSGTGIEYLQVSSVSTNGATVLSTTTPFLYDHAASVTVSTITATPGPLVVIAGAV